MVADGLFQRSQRLAHEQCRGQRQQAQENRGNGQGRAEPKHHNQGRDKHNTVKYQVKKVIQVVFLKGIHVIGQDGQISARALLGKGADSLLRQAGKGQRLIPGQRLPDERGPCSGTAQLYPKENGAENCRQL